MVRDELAQRLRMKRAQMGYSQEKLAELSNLSVMAISNYENAKASPNARSLCALCDALETTPNFLLGWSADFTQN